MADLKCVEGATKMPSRGLQTIAGALQLVHQRVCKESKQAVCHVQQGALTSQLGPLL